MQKQKDFKNTREEHLDDLEVQKNFLKDDTQPTNYKRSIDKMFYIKMKLLFIKRFHQSEKTNYTLREDICNPSNLQSTSIRMYNYQKAKSKRHQKNIIEQILSQEWNTMDNKCMHSAQGPGNQGYLN